MMEMCRMQMKKRLVPGKTVAVKSLPANPWGLYEMHGKFGNGVLIGMTIFL